MAIHPLVPGIEVAICVNQIPLPEYDDDEVWPGTVTSASGHTIKTITKYIESTANQEFSIMTRIEPPYRPDSPSLVFYFYLDGKPCSGMVFARSQHNRLHYTTGVDKQGKEKGHGVLMPFKFTNIETSAC